MMRKYLFLVLLLLTSAMVWSQNGDKSKQLKAYFSALTEIGNFNGNVVVAQEGRVLLRENYRMPGAPEAMAVDSKSRFVVASVSKVFVKYAVLRLVEMGRLGLEDPLSRFLPEFPAGQQIKVAHLLHHQSGLPRELKDYESHDSISLQMAVKLAQAEALEFEPGTQTLYSNVGYLLLHHVIDKASDQGYWKFMADEVFARTGMRHTVEYHAAKKIPHFAQGFMYEDGKVVAAPAEAVDRFETGNVVSTADDLYRFSERLRRYKAQDDFLLNHLFGEKRILLQAGGRPGYRAYLYMDLNLGITLIFTANYTEIPIESISKDIVHLLLGEPYVLPAKIERAAVNLPAEVLQRYVGKYVLEADRTQTFEVKVKEGGLLITDGDGEETQFMPDREDTFFNDPHSRDGLEFQRNETTGQYDIYLITTGVRLRAVWQD